MMNHSSRRGGLAAVFLAGSIGVGSMSGCGAALIAGAGYLAAEEIAQSNVEAARIRAQAQNRRGTHASALNALPQKPAFVDGRRWKENPLERYPAGAKSQYRYWGTLGVYDDGIQFDTLGATVGGEPERVWWISIPYSCIQSVSNTEQYRTFLGYAGDDYLTVDYDNQGSLETIRFDICFPDTDKATEATDCTLLANRIREKVRTSK